MSQKPNIVLNICHTVICQDLHNSSSKRVRSKKAIKCPILWSPGLNLKNISVHETGLLTPASEKYLFNLLPSTTISHVQDSDSEQLCGRKEDQLKLSVCESEVDL